VHFVGLFLVFIIENARSKKQNSIIHICCQLAMFTASQRSNN